MLLVVLCVRLQSSIEKISVFIVYSTLCRAIKSSIEKTLFLKYNLFYGQNTSNLIYLTLYVTFGRIS